MEDTEWQDEGFDTEQMLQSRLESTQNDDAEETEPVDDIRSLYNQGLQEIETLGLTDIGSLASWSVSSFKPGCGMEALREDNPELYWQSDGLQPHHVDIHFSKRVAIERISIFNDYLVDESYTPSKIVVCAGTGYQDLSEVATISLNEPRGWSDIKLDGVRSDGVLKTFLVRLSIAVNHQNGKDTHLRAVKLYSPLKNDQNIAQELDIPFTSIAMLSESVVR
ncbi:anaphase-promoting complex, subunit 10 [Nadsonia fulvescens var. elongata DSM 6958]|uniref:Anaphase-promoting complex subunit 10 n=1 Tax=Nadsonia fulvescens var. elongata DSM 6958 TaxID=857566 RepID=A0A1E3PMR0_9ASCO|nr:anaphase-promoting complex, subunit 10 [Nadsonia fulvescens var. elongata DSM 6958]